LRQVTGAQALIATLTGAGVDVCFTNPGTSEMHFVQAMDSVPAMRGVLALFEGVATGAADGYARIAGRPASVLLHLGPGLANGLANLHNARRAHSPVVCIVGAHATGHARYDAPLHSDIESAARTVSGWVHTAGTARGLAADTVRAIAAARADGGQVATLIVPADVSWDEGGQPAPPYPVAAPLPADPGTIEETARLLRGNEPAMLLVGGAGLSERGLRAASRVAAATGAGLLAQTHPARLEGGAGVPPIRRLAYFPEQADKQLAGTAVLVLAGAASPVSFFAYPGRPSGDLVPEGTAVLDLARPEQDVAGALEQLADAVGAPAEPVIPAAPAPVAGTGPLTVGNLGDTIAASLPEQAIVVDEANTSSAGMARTGAGAAGPRARRLLDLSDPVPDFTALAAGFGVPASRVTTAEELDAALRRAHAEPGPKLIEAIVPPVA
jgi:acetolactate synthase-1/2/3 large subunit